MSKIVETTLGRFNVSNLLTTGLLFKKTEMDWETAFEKAAKHGGRWRLPTLAECQVIHSETDAFDNLEEDLVLWCLEEYTENLECAFIYDSSGILTGHWNKKELYYAIAIKQEF